MAGSNINQNTFLHGELSPSVQGATESELYNHGLSRCFNSYIQQTGGIYKREGSKVSYIFNTLEDGTYPRYLYAAKTTTNHPCVLALTPGTLEIFTRSGRRSVTKFEALTVEQLQNGTTIIPYKNFFWLFLQTGIFKISIDDNYIITLEDISGNMIIPLTPFNIDAGKFVTITRLEGDEEFKLTFSSDINLDPSLLGQYIQVGLDLVNFNPVDEKEVTNLAVTTHHLLTFSILDINVVDGVTVVSGHYTYAYSTLKSTSDKFPINTPISKYSVPAFGRHNIPTCACMYRGRLYLAKEDTNIVYGSCLIYSEEINFLRTAQESTGLISSIVSCRNIYWLVATDAALCVGTSSGVYVMDDPAPTLMTLSFKLFSNVHVSRAAPMAVNSSVFFVDHGGTRVFEIAKDEISGSYKTYDVGLLSQHLLEKGVTSIAYSAYPASLLFCTLTNGDFLLMGYNRSNDIYAWTRHRLGGFDTHVDNVRCVNFYGKDYFFLSVTRRQNGKLVRSIEYIENNYASETDNRYASCYVDSCHTSSLKTRIQSIDFGRPLIIDFDASLSTIPDSRLLITTSTNDPASALWISDFAVSLTRVVSTTFQHMPEHKDFKFEDDQNPKLSVFQKVNNPRAPMAYQCQLITNDDDNLCLRLIGGARDHPVFAYNSVFIFTNALELVDSVFNNVKKFVISNERGGMIWEDGGWTIVLLDKETKQPVQLIEQVLEEAIDVTDNVWVSVGDGIVNNPAPACIEVDDIKKKCGFDSDIVSHLREPIYNDEVINVLEDVGVCTRRKVFMNAYTLNVMPDKIESFGGFCPFCANDDPGVWCITKDRLLGMQRCNDINGEHIITTGFVDDHNVITQINDIIANRNVLLTDVLSAAKYTICAFDAVYIIITPEGQLHEVMLYMKEEVVCLDGKLFITNKRIIDVSTLDEFEHPFDTAVQCACIFSQNANKTLFVGGIGGLLWRFKQAEGWVQVLHNRHMTIRKIVVLDDNLLAYSRYGDGLLFSTAVSTAKAENNTITTDRKDIPYPMSVVQFCNDASEDGNDFLIEHFSVLLKIDFDRDAETCFAPTHTDDILVHGITSFDFLNGQTLEVLQVVGNKIYISIPLGADNHVFDQALDVDGEVYFKTYSCAGLSRYYNQELRVTVDGMDRGDETILNDAVYIPRGGYSINVGYPYEQQIFTLDLSGGAVKGSSVGAIARQITLCLRVLNSSSGEYSTDGLKWYPIAFTKYTHILHGVQVYTGVIKMTLPNGIRNVTTRMLYIRNKKAEPLNILSITRETYVSDN